MQFVYLLIKDMKNIFYDIKSLAVIILMPVVLMTILGMSLQGVFGEEGDSGVANVTIGIVKAYDFDQEMAKVEGRVTLSDYDDETIEGLNPEKNFFTMMDSEEMTEFLAYELMTKEQGMAALEAGEITALIILPKNFVYNSYMMLTGSRLVSDIEYYMNPEKDFLAGIILGIIESYADLNNQVYAQTRLVTMKLLSHDRMDDLGNIGDLMKMETVEDAGIQVAVKGVQREESINSFQYYAAAIMCMFLLYTAGIGGRALLEEKREGTIPRLVVGGHGIGTAVASNFIRVMLLAMSQSGIMIVYSDLVLGVDWGSRLSVVVTVVVSSFAVAAIGLLIGVITLIADNYKAANAFEFGLVYIMALVGGSFIPVEGLPKFLRQLGFLSVNGQALKMYINGMYHLPLHRSLSSMTALVVFGLTFIAVSLVLMRRKGGGLAC